MRKERFQVADMHCTACVMRLEMLEDELPGIRRVQASYRKQTLEVEYDETIVTREAILAAVKAKGYDAVPLP